VGRRVGRGRRPGRVVHPEVPPVVAAGGHDAVRVGRGVSAAGRRAAGGFGPTGAARPRLAFPGGHFQSPLPFTPPRTVPAAAYSVYGNPPLSSPGPVRAARS